MKKYIVLSILCLTFLCLSSIVFGDEHDYDLEWWSQGGGCSIGPVSIIQAEEAIKNWAGRQNLTITLEPVHEWEPHPGRCAHGVSWIGETVVPQLIQCYAFSVSDPNSDGKYNGMVYVDSYTGEIVKFTTGRQFEVEWQGDTSQMLPPNTIVNLADNYVNSYFPNIPLNEFQRSVFYSSEEQLSEESWTMKSYNLNEGQSWQAFSPLIHVGYSKSLTTAEGEKIFVDFQKIFVTIDSITGRLCEIICVYEPIQVATQPTISSEEAAEIVLSHFYGLGYQNVSFPQSEFSQAGWSIKCEAPNGPQRLSRCFEVEVWTNDMPQMFLVEVDGHSGEIWAGDASMGAPVSKEEYARKVYKGYLVVVFNGRVMKPLHEPFIQRDQLFISLEDLKAMGFKLSKRTSGYIISFKGGIITLTGRDVVRREGREYIKADKLKGIKNIMVEYDKILRRINIWCKNEKAYKSAQEIAKKTGGTAHSAPQSQRKKSERIPIILSGGLSFSAICYLFWRLIYILA
jgi:hypothetical protein